MIKICTLLSLSVAAVVGDLTCLDVKHSYKDAKCCEDLNNKVDTLCKHGTPQTRTTSNFKLFYKRADGVPEATAFQVQKLLVDSGKTFPGYLAGGVSKPAGCDELCPAREFNSEFDSTDSMIAYLQLLVSDGMKETVKTVFTTHSTTSNKPIVIVPSADIPKAESAVQAVKAKLDSWFTEWGFTMMHPDFIIREWSPNTFDKRCHGPPAPLPPAPLPPAPLPPAPLPPAPSPVASPSTIVDIVVASESHTVLEEAVIKADLATALQAAGPFTLFAPTDDAFTAALQDLALTKAQLLDLANLPDILKHHVISSKIVSGDIATGETTVTTLAGTSLTVTKSASGVFIGTTQVTTPDLEAGNGVVHVVNGVLMPPAAPQECKDNDDEVFFTGSAIDGYYSAKTCADMKEKDLGSYAGFGFGDPCTKTVAQVTQDKSVGGTSVAPVGWEDKTFAEFCPVTCDACPARRKK